MLLRQLLEYKTPLPMLAEGRGLAARLPGEKFKNPEGDVIISQGVEFFPERGQFANQIDMKAELDNQSSDKNVHWTNNVNASMLAFAIASFTDEAGTPYYLGRYYKTISPNRMENDWQHKDIPGGFKYQSKAGVKESSGYKPSEVLTQLQNNTVNSIVSQLTTKFGQGSDEIVALNAFMSAKSFPITFPKGTINFAAFTDYFCEMLQPIALVRGMNVSGNAADAADVFFKKGAGYTGCTISFNAGVTGGLYDSLLVSPDGKQIKLSSKGKGGANASVVNLLKSIDELKETPKGKVLLQKHKIVIDILNDINTGGHFNAPLKLAADYNLIDKDDIPFALTLRKYGPTDAINWDGHAKLEALYNGRKARDMAAIIPIEHMVSAVAYKVADYINTNTNFGVAASDILNHSALVQMYSNTSEGKDTITINDFHAVYPAETVSGVLLDASKTYMSTQGKGNFTFKILKGGATAEEVDIVTGGSEPAAAAPKKGKPEVTPPGKEPVRHTTVARELK